MHTASRARNRQSHKREQAARSIGRYPQPVDCTEGVRDAGFPANLTPLPRLPLPIMIELRDVDLRGDPAAGRYAKDETVAVEFAKTPGQLTSLEGPNAYVPGDALVTGTGGARWVVARERFDAKYLPAVADLPHGEPGPYRNRPAVVLAKRMDVPFSIARSADGDVLRGAAGDWVMQYAPGDYGVVQAQRFAAVYRRAD
jgi:PGDYG protein